MVNNNKKDKKFNFICLGMTRTYGHSSDSIMDSAVGVCARVNKLNQLKHEINNKKTFAEKIKVINI